MSNWQTTGTDASGNVSGNYISASDIDNWADGDTDAEKLTAIQRAEQLIERLTSDYFYEKSQVFTVDGNDKKRLFIPSKSDLLSVTAVKWYGDTIDEDYYTYDTHSIYLDPSTVIGYLHQESNEILFPSGLKNIEITCTIGWSTTPRAIKDAAIILVRADNDSTLYSQYSMNEQESVEGYSFKRGKFLTGIHEADKLIYPYIRRRPGLGCV